MTIGMTKKQKIIFKETQTLLDEIRTKPWLAKGMSEHGYDTTGLVHGEALANTAAELARVRAEAKSVQLGATDDFYERYDRYWPHFQLAMQHAVHHLQGQTEYLDLLGLHESRLNGSGTSQISKPGKNDKFEETLPWLINFYERIQNHREILAILTTYGFPAEKLAKDMERVQALVQAKSDQDRAIAAKEQAVKHRNAAFKRLKSWLRRAQAVAKAVKKEYGASEPDSVEVEV